jgi:hypothetical protein
MSTIGAILGALMAGRPFFFLHMSFVTGEGTTMPTTLTDVPLPGRVVAYAKLPCVICPGRSTNFCRPLEEQLQAELFHTVARQRWEPREFLFRKGDPAGPLFKITEGIASVSHSLPDGRRPKAPGSKRAVRKRS